MRNYCAYLISLYIAHALAQIAQIGSGKMDTRKEEERAELHRTIWKIADDLRGSVDGWDFKAYVLCTMFYRYISENLCDYINKDEHESEGGDPDFDYAKISDEDAEPLRSEMISEKGFFILPSELFCNVLKNAPQDSNLNETLSRVFRNIEASSQGTDSSGDFKGLFSDYDVNNIKLADTVEGRNKRFVKLLQVISEMKLGSVNNNVIEAFGDAYEYLMGLYASNAGKSGGEYFTPAEVSMLLTRLGTTGKSSISSVYDPACGSGSLLLKTKKVLGIENINGGFYGQEKNVTSYNLCRMNMFLHDVNFNKFEITCGDTLINPQIDANKKFELVVSNPPYSTSWEGDSNPLMINDPRFAPAGVLAPKSKADMAFVLHCLAHLAEDGAAAIVCFPGIMYRGGAEQKIRQYLIEHNAVDCVIQLPSNLFFGTSIATCIMVLRKNKQNDTSILFVDASQQFVKSTNSNKLSDENIEQIVKWYTSRQDVEHIAHVASLEEVESNKYNLSVSTYVEVEDTREKINITELNAQIASVCAREQELREQIEKIVSEIEAGSVNFDNSEVAQ
ncbi:type I restriction system adenine methylase (hsdM) [Gardnerella vaginalis 5-1]|nr:type I restriction system adenine methylase (hsdM) [Gardnerella vaginalis 5-1]